MADLNLKPPLPKNFCKPGMYTTGYTLLPSPTATTEPRLWSIQQKESSPITQDQMATSTFMQYKEPSFFTETHQIQQPNSPMLSYSLDGPLGISFQHYLDDTSPTSPGRKASLPVKRPFTTDIFLLMSDGRNTLNTSHL